MIIELDICHHAGTGNKYWRPGSAIKLLDVIPGLSSVQGQPTGGPGQHFSSDSVSRDEALAARLRHEASAKQAKELNQGRKLRTSPVQSACIHYLAEKVLKVHKGQKHWIGIWESKLGVAIMGRYFADGDHETIRTRHRTLNLETAMEYIRKHGDPSTWPDLAPLSVHVHLNYFDPILESAQVRSSYPSSNSWTSSGLGSQ